MNKEDWEVKKLENCFEFIRNGANIKQDSFAKGFPITRIETLSNDVFNRDRLGYANIFETEKYKKYLLYDKDILMSHINSMKYLGRAVLYIKKSDEIIIHGMNLLNLRAIKSILRPEFACYYFGSRSFKSDIYKIAKKAVNQASFTISSLKSISIPIPPLPIQTQIVAELGELNAILDKKRKQLEELDTLAQATFYDMFGDPVLNDKGWEVKKLNQLAVLKAGKFIKASDIASDNTGLLYKCYGANGLRGYVSAYNHFGTHVLIGRQGALCGNVTLAKGKFYATEHAVVVTPLIKSESLWLLYILDYLNLNRYATGAAQPGLSVNKINNIIIPFPPIVLQYQFAERIEAIEAQKELINQSIKEVQLLFDYTMDKYFN